MNGVTLTLSRKKVVLGVVGVFLFFVILLGLGGGILILRAPATESVSGYHISSDNLDEERSTFKIEKGGWYITYVGTGDRLIEVQNNNKKVIYQPRISIFSIRNIGIDIQPQKQSINLGYQNSDCLINDRENTQVVFYFCNKAMSDQSIYSLTNNGVDYSNAISGAKVQPYYGGTLEINDQDEASSPSIDHLTFNSNSISRKTQSLPTPGDTSTGVLATDLKNINNQRFIYYDGNSKDLYVYKKFGEQPIKHNLSPHISGRDDFSVSMLLVDKYLYIVYGISSDSSGFGDYPLAKEVNGQQKIVKIDTDTNTLVSQTKIADTLFNKEFSVSKNGDVVLFMDNTSNQKREVYIDTNNSLKRVNIVGNVSSICWNNNNIYYSLSTGSSIYQYSMNNNASHLAYDNPMDIIIHLQCNYGEIAFPSLSKDSGESDYRWFVLSDDNLNDRATRVENIFPILYDRIGNIISAYAYKDSAFVRLGDVDSIERYDVTCPVSSDESEKAVAYIKSLGVDTSLLKFRISKNC